LAAVPPTTSPLPGKPLSNCHSERSEESPAFIRTVLIYLQIINSTNPDLP